MKSFVVFSLFLATLGCATKPTAEALKIVDADERMVQNCKLLETITGGSSFVGQKGKYGARAEALNEAVKMGATHMVWISVTDGMVGSTANGRAYKCE